MKSNLFYEELLKFEKRISKKRTFQILTKFLFKFFFVIKNRNRKSILKVHLNYDAKSHLLIIEQD